MFVQGGKEINIPRGRSMKIIDRFNATNEREEIRKGKK